MILTCPECGTKYVVKDGAIPDGGRKVRCASCKHSWHQDPEVTAAEVEALTEVEPDPAMGYTPEPVEPVVDPTEPAPPGEPAAPAPVVADEDDGRGPPADPVADETPSASDPRDWQPVDTGSAWAPQAAATTADDDDFQPFTHADDDEPAAPRRWPLVLGIILLIAAAVVAFWYFAPAAVKQQVGLAQGSSPLEVMNTSNERQKLESGNDLLTVSGRIINPTGTSQPVPPLRAELLDESKTRVIHSWMISPPVDTLSPNESSTFHSAEMGVPEGGKFLRVRLSTAG